MPRRGHAQVQIEETTANEGKETAALSDSLYQESQTEKVLTLAGAHSPPESEARG